MPRSDNNKQPGQRIRNSAASPHLSPAQHLRKAIAHFRREAHRKTEEAASQAGPRKVVLKRQARILHTLADALTGLEDNRGAREAIKAVRSPRSGRRGISPGMIKDPDYRADMDALERAMLQAACHGLGDDPYVKEWFDQRRLLGDRETLRRGKAGLETGVKHALPAWDEHVGLRTAELHQEGLSAEIIRREIMADEDRPPGKSVSREAIRKRLNHL